MILKKIEMAGFKSFADKTVLDFNENFSAIVGPNGCGKSNVADAIRWVLGEQKVKDLRADSMQDVIFNGTEKRRSLSYCEVSLIFDNSARFFNFEYDELIITRKLYRSGESEYLINKNTCRLLDINNILYNSGLGKTGYSIVGQGKVTEMVESKPETRRAMFEDAAGISKYKKDKTDAENRLSRTRGNLERVNDILQEISRQLGPLKSQAEIAKKYLQLKNQLKDLEVNAYVYQFENANQTKEKINEKMTAIDEELAIRQSEFDAISLQYATAMEDSLTFDRKLSQLNNEILNLTVVLEKEAGESRILRERIVYLEKENSRVNLDISNSEILIKNIEKEIENKELSLQETQQKMSSLEEAFDTLSQEYSNCANELSSCENDADLTQQKIIETLGDLSDIKSNMSKFLAEKDLLSSRFETLKKAVEEQNSKKTELLSLHKNEKQNYEKIKAELEGFEKNLKDISLKISLAESKMRKMQDDKGNFITQIKVCENRKKLLTEMQADFEGYAYSVKKLLKESEKDKALRENFVGTVASLISMPQKFETAIEVATGSALQNIITKDEQQAKNLISFLKKNSYGRATFLPISSMKRRNFDETKIKKTSGYLGIASQIIKYPSNIENVISSLLGGVVICENLENAVLMAKENGYSFKIVTLEGDVINPQGSMTGGSKKTESTNIINRNREIQDLGKSIQDLEKNLSALEKEISVLKEEENCLKSQQNEILEKRNSSNISLSASSNKNENYRTIIEQLQNDMKVSMLEKTTVENKLIFLTAELEKHTDMENQISGREDSVSKIIKEKQEKNNLIREKLDKISLELTGVKVEKARVEAGVESLKNEISRLQAEENRVKNILLENNKNLEKNNILIQEGEEIIANLLKASGNQENKNKLQALNLSKEKIEEEKVDIVTLLKKLDGEKTSLIESLGKVNDKKYREEMNLAKVDSDIEIMQERIYEEYTLVYDDCLQFKRPDFDIRSGLISINKFKREITALGPVNVNAIEDSGSLMERYEDMKTQSDDLLKAEEDLTKIIKDLSSIMVEKFLTEFNKINESFKITFKELFGGGNARLELCDESRPLESGVEVFVQPPGKKIQNMSLYSGGEKSLTAMAIIFAILRIKPLPFCLFDEVESALDDTNVEIIDKYLKKLSTDTQFILITHKKPTMEHAQALFGVTMEEKGVSKIVSVKLSEAIKNAEEDRA